MALQAVSLDPARHPSAQATQHAAALEGYRAVVVPATASATPPSGQSDQTIVEVAASDSRFSTLVSLVQQAGLADALSSGTVTVFAAASLTESFTTLGKQFQGAHPCTTVRFNFGASSSLAENINQGAPADVFASASPKNMQQVVAAGGAGDSKTFANNVMEIAVPPDNPADVTGRATSAAPR